MGKLSVVSGAHLSRCAGVIPILLAIALLSSAALGEAFAGPVPLRELVEADWIQRDAVLSVAEPFSIVHTREVIRQGRALAERLRDTADAAQIGLIEAELDRVEEQLGEIDVESERRAIYLEARWMVRRIAFCNPLLDFEELLFIKRHAAKGVFHMCDQYYGFNAVAGGGLFVLSDPFGERPSLRNILEKRTVESGRLAESTLAGGAFLSPELSFDGEQILFAWTQAQGKDLEWSSTASYHLFRVQADGTGLVQLTDGEWNDFDPCYLPSGRVVFVTERRGGYLRCGRHCPTYTMFSMAADGSDIQPLSYHETHEWHPSVNNDGMLVYTRWDYVDRDTNIAHHIWTCFPDGRDPRTSHGNYPAKRELRPWMEMSIRAIPNSHKYVATAAAHHGHAFGSLVLIDPRVPDDGAMAQLTRLTPEVPFPESEKHLRPIEECMVYATPWPLSEDDYLCAYDPESKNHGIYWIDRFGNKELLYRDPEIPCLSPIPLRPRPMPPVIPDQTDHAEDTATVAVTNAYDSDFEWPEETKVAALRIIQVLPKTTPPPNEPRIGIADQTNARAVLGTVPVEADGSAHFTVPAGRLVYFQAIDAQGMAIQSMRSGAYLQPGERLVCAGCHEPKHEAPAPPKEVALALLRPPSDIAPEFEDANPFNYVRLVQPVLDRNCVDCHVQEDALDLRGVIEGEHGWTRSYTNLAKDYGFYFNVRNGSINDGVHGGVKTIAGEFGARVAPLRAYLDADHYEVNLTDDEFRRIALWLDCNSEFYGAYENTEAQSRGEVVQPSLY
jgi:hypothetical protein